MSDVIFWQGVDCTDEARSIILGADFSQVRSVLRGVEYRETITSHGVEPHRIDYARDKLAGDPALLTQARRALLMVYNAARHGDKDGVQVNIAGMHLRQALSHLVDSSKDPSEDCPIVPMGIEIAQNIYRLVARP